MRLQLVLVALVCALTSACGRTPPRQDAGRRTERPATAVGAIHPGDPPAFRKQLRARRGTPVVVNFWASWCIPCIAEMPRLVDAAKRYEGRVAFLGVDVEDVGSEARAFLQRLGVPFPSLADPRGEIRRDQRVLGLPVTQFYRSDGRLAFAHVGEISADELETKLREVLRATVPEPTPALS